MGVFDPKSIMSYCRDWNSNNSADGWEAGAPGVDLDKLSKGDIDGVRAAYGFTGSTTVTGANVPINCGNNAVLRVGDFTADGVSDYLCKSATQVWARNGASSATFSANSTWCTGASDSMLIGDVSGDNRADLVCVTPTGLYADNASPIFSSLFGTVDQTNLAWVGAPNVRYFLGNFNNAGPLEVVRLDIPGRLLSVDFIGSPFDWTGFIPANTACLTSTTSQITVGEMSGDRIDDIICASPSDGKWYAFPTSPLGTWIFNLPYVLPPWLDSGLMIVDVSGRGDFDGDGKVDFVYPLPNGISMRFGSSFIAPHAEPTWSTRTSDFSGPIGGLFNSNGMRITPARVNTDAREDLIVYGRTYGSFTKMPIPAGFHAP
jgi:hypothetical protein